MAFTWIVSAVLTAAGLFSLWKARKEREEMKGFSRQIEHFLLYGEGALQESLEVGGLADLNDQLSRLEQALIYQREQSGLREKQITGFVENMAHQMKNTLTALQIQLDLLSLHISPQAQAALDSSQECMERLTNEIDRILKSSQLAAGKAAMRFELLDLKRTVSSCAEKLAPLAAAKGSSFVIDGPETLEISGDGFWLAQALENLMKNAVEHTAENTDVHVALRDNGSRIAVRIEDEGGGIPPGEFSDLFTRFHRGSFSKAGYGVGLSMAKDIAQAHHGTLTAGNRPEKGAWFELSLPVLEGARTYETE